MFLPDTSPVSYRPLAGSLNAGPRVLTPVQGPRAGPIHSRCSVREVEVLSVASEASIECSQAEGRRRTVGGPSEQVPTPVSAAAGPPSPTSSSCPLHFDSLGSASGSSVCPWPWAAVASGTSWWPFRGWCLVQPTGFWGSACPHRVGSQSPCCQAAWGPCPWAELRAKPLGPWPRCGGGRSSSYHARLAGPGCCWSGTPRARSGQACIWEMFTESSGIERVRRPSGQQATTNFWSSVGTGR